MMRYNEVTVFIIPDFLDSHFVHNLHTEKKESCAVQLTQGNYSEDAAKSMFDILNLFPECKIHVQHKKTAVRCFVNCDCGKKTGCRIFCFNFQTPSFSFLN